MGAEGIFAIFAGAGIVLLLILIALVVLLIIAEWKVFEKAGKPGWASIIPFYSQYVLFQIVYGDSNGIKFLLLLVPFLGEIVALVSMYRLGQAFGQGTGFCIGLIFLPNIFTLILGFGSQYYYQGPVQVSFI